MKTIQAMYEHVHWANQKILEALQRKNSEDQQAQRLFAHVLLAEQVWLARLQGKDTNLLPLWSDLDLSVCEELVLEHEKIFAQFIAADFDRLISYTNSKGQTFNTSIQDILVHVALHGHYHRGQINTLLRAAGCEPAGVDYITYVRANEQ